MFQFPGLAHLSVCHVFNMTGCPIRISAVRRLYAPTRSFSQLTTSFIASQCLGIRHTPLFALNNFYFFSGGYSLLSLYTALACGVHRV